MTLILRKPWTRQPQTIERLKERAQVYSGPTLATHFGDLWTPGNAPAVVATAQGIGRTFTAASSQTLSATYSGPSAAGFTLLAVLRRNATGVNQGIVGIGAATSNRHLLYYTSSNLLTMFSGDTGTSSSAQAGSAHTDTATFQVVAGRVSSTTSRDVWRNGVKLASNTASVNPSGINTVGVAGYYNSGAFTAGFYLSADVIAAGVIYRALSDAELEFVTAAPENVFASLFAPRRLIIPVSAGAASGTGSITQADGVATTSTLTGSSVAATTPTQADGVATAATLAGSSIAAAAFTQADGVATTSTLVGSDAGGSAITSADGVATTSTLVGSSIAAADFVVAAGTSTGETLVPFGAVVASSAPVGGGIPKRRRRRYQVEVDGEVFYVDSPAEAEAVLEQVKQTAQEQAKTAVERAAKATKREPRKVLQDARRAMPAPVIDAPAELAESIARVQSEIRSIYADALRDVEIALLMRRAELEADDEDVLLLL